MPVTPAAELIARRYLVREACNLVTYREVGLPFYRLRLHAIVLEKTALGAMREFVLRAVAAGMQSVRDVARLLGLERDAAEPLLAELIANRDLAIASLPGVGPMTLQLTAKGRVTLDQLGTVKPEEVPVTLDYDALLRRVVLPFGELVTPEELDAAGALPIRPARAAAPEAEDLDRLQVEALIHELDRGRRKERRDLLGFSPLQRRQRYRLFLPALMLVYRRTKDGEAEIAFSVGGRLRPDLEQAFASTRQKKRISAQVARAPSVEESVEGLIGEKLIERARKSRAPELQSLISEATQLDDLEESAGEELKNRAAVAAATLATENVRYLETFEHPAILERALEESKEKLLIVAPWIRPAVVDASFLDRLEILLKRDVRVVIAWGIEASTKAKDADPRVLAKLEELCGRFKKLTVHWLGNTHAKVLISDDKFVVAGSFNWLSFKGDPAQTFRDERSFLIAHGPTVRRAFDIEMKKLGLKP